MKIMPQLAQLYKLILSDDRRAVILDNYTNAEGGKVIEISGEALIKPKRSKSKWVPMRDTIVLKPMR